MAERQGRRNGNEYAGQRNNRSYYVSGNTVRKSRQNSYQPVYTVRNGGRVDSRSNGSLSYLIVLSVALVLTGLILTWYITMQSEITSSVKNIASLESQYNELKSSNDEAYNQANSSLDLDEIKRIAIQEYGMQYADQGQIVTYSDEGGNDYVHQSSEIPSEKVK